MRKRILAATIAIVAAAAAAGAWRVSTRPAARKWNVLVVVADTVRADHVSINGYQRLTTPNLDLLAREGVNFRQAITAAPRTWQSFATILTGLYPPHHGVRFINDHPLATDVPTMATLLKEHGYAASAFDPLRFLRGITGEHGFDDYQDTVFSPDRPVVESAWKWIATPRQQPFFAFIRLNGGHWPYAADGQDVGDFDSCEGFDHTFNALRLGRAGVRFDEPGKGMRLVNREAYRKAFFTVPFDERTLHHVIAHYDAAVRRADANIGWLIDQLRAAGLLEQTIVVVTADHGESFGEHGYLQHGPRVDEPVMRVPLIIRLPAAHPDATPGLTIDAQVRTVDILPTILDAVGKAPPRRLDGVSLLPAMGGGTPPDLWAYGESERDYVGLDPECFIEGVKGTHRMIRQDGWKLVYIPKPNAAEYRLYDLRSAANETNNVADQHPDKVRQLRGLLEGILVADQDRPSRETELTDAEREQLHRLGYL